MSQPKFHLRKVVVTGCKGVISLAVISIIVSHINRSVLLHDLRLVSPGVIVVLVLILAVQTSAVAGLRLKLLLSGLKITRPLSAMWQVAIGGFFVEQVAFGMAGGDVLRFWLLRRLDVPVSAGAAAIIVDRFIGLAALLLMAAIGLPRLFVLLPKPDWQPIILIGLAVFVLVVFVAAFVLRCIWSSARYWLTDVAHYGLNTIRYPGFRFAALYVFVLALLTQVTNVFMLFLVGRDLGISVGLENWFLIAPPALLLAALPITSGGWGLREASFVIALGSFGVPLESAVVPSIVFGFGVLLVTLPGGIVLLLSKQASKPAAVSQASTLATVHVATATSTLHSKHHAITPVAPAIIDQREQAE